MNFLCTTICLCILFICVNARFITKRQIKTELPKVITTKTPQNRTVWFWTKEQMQIALANPFDWIINEENNTNATRQKRSIWTKSKMQSAVAIDSELSPETLIGLGIEPPEMTEFAELSPKNYADVDDYPFNNFGKLFLTSSKGSGHCSAGFIRERVLITAAHCVKDSEWFENFAFYQRFDGTDNTGREVNILKPFAYSTYISEDGAKDPRYDYAFLTTVESDDVTPLSDDFSGEFGDEETIYFAGYPADTDEANRLIWSSSTRNSDVTNLIHCPSNPLLHGSSGGPWMTLDESGVYSVVGVASHGKPALGYSGAFSSVLNNETADLLATAEDSLNSESGETTEPTEETTEEEVVEEEN